MKHAEKKSRTQWVIILTFITMIVEIVAGMMTGSMALLADGWHMGSHVGALGIAWLGYYLIEKESFRQRYTFGGGKVLVLGGYTSAVLLIATAGWMIMESAERFTSREPLQAKEAMIVAVIGLVVNLVCALILQHKHDHGHSHASCDHDHGHSHVRPAGHSHSHSHDHGHTDLNMAGAYAHVLADAMTSVLALVALGLAEWQDWWWADPVVGILGALMIIKWGYGLLRQSAHELLDGTVSTVPTQGIQTLLETRGLKVSCMHAWRLDGEKTALHVRASSPGFSPEELPALRAELMKKYPIEHLVIEVGRDSDHCQL